YLTRQPRPSHRSFVRNQQSIAECRLSQSQGRQCARDRPVQSSNAKNSEQGNGCRRTDLAGVYFEGRFPAQKKLAAADPSVPASPDRIAASFSCSRGLWMPKALQTNATGGDVVSVPLRNWKANYFPYNRNFCHESGSGTV